MARPMPTSWVRDKNEPGGNTSGNPPGGGGEMDARVTALEKSNIEIREKLVKIESRLDSIDSHMASKADLQSVRAQLEASMRTQLQWFVGLTWTVSIALVGATYFMATHLTK